MSKHKRNPLVKEYYTIGVILSKDEAKQMAKKQMEEIRKREDKKFRTETQNRKETFKGFDKEN